MTVCIKPIIYYRIFRTENRSIRLIHTTCGTRRSPDGITHKIRMYNILYTYDIHLHRGDIVRSFCINILYGSCCRSRAPVRRIIVIICIRIGHGTANLVYILYTHERVCRNTRGHWSKATAAIARSNILLFRQLPVNRIINVKYNI